MISKSTKFSEVSGALATITGVVSVQEIIDAILQIDNFKSKTLVNMKTNATYNPNEVGVVPLSKLYVDVTYQRVLRLKKLVNKLKKMNGYDMYSAGVIDIAIRPCGDSYVWDGLRRCVMAGLCGLTHVKSSQFIHPMSSSIRRCQKTEAQYFKSRNADNENMKAEEIFKSEVVFGDPRALELLEMIKNCGLDIEGLNPLGGRVFGGFVEFRNVYFSETNGLSHMSDEWVRVVDNFIIAASIIRRVYPTGVVSGYFLTGLYELLKHNDDCDSSYDEEEIIDAFKTYAVTHPKQTDVIRGRLAGNAKGSIAYLIARRVLKDTNGLVNSLNLNGDDVTLMDELILEAA